MLPTQLVSPVQSQITTAGGTFYRGITLCFDTGAELVLIEMIVDRYFVDFPRWLQ